MAQLPPDVRSYSSNDLATVQREGQAQLQSQCSSSTTDLERFESGQSSRPPSSVFSSASESSISGFSRGELEYATPETHFQTLNSSSLSLPPQEPPSPIHPVQDEDNLIRRYTRMKIASHDIKQSISLKGRHSLPFKSRQLPFQVTDDKTGVPMSQFPTIAHILQLRAQATPKDIAFAIVDGKYRDPLSSFWSSTTTITFEKLHSNAVRIARQLSQLDRRHKQVILLYQREEILELITGMFACFYAGFTAVPVATGSTSIDDEVAEIMLMIEAGPVTIAMTTEVTYKTLNRIFSSSRGSFPKLHWIKTTSITISKVPELLSYLNAEELAYVEYTKSPLGELKGLIMDHHCIINNCAMLKGSHGLSSSDIMISQLDPRQQTGLLASVFLAIYTGFRTMFLFDESNSADTLFSTIANSKTTILLCDQRNLLASISGLHEQSTRKSLSQYGLLKKAIVPLLTLPEMGGIIIAMHDRVTCTNTDPQTTKKDLLDIHVCLLALREGRIDIQAASEKGKTIHLIECGYPVHDVSIAIVDPYTQAFLPRGHIGEIWVEAPSLIPKGFWGLPRLSAQFFAAKGYIVEDQILHPGHFARTGLYGFLVDESVVPGVGHPRLFSVGLCKDVIWQKRTGEEIAELDKMNPPIPKWSLLREMSFHISNVLVETVYNRVSGIEACAIFEIVLANAGLPVVLIESSKSSENLPYISANTIQCLYNHHKLRPYCLMILPPNTLPRMGCDTKTSESGFRSHFSGYSPGVVSSGYNSKSHSTSAKINTDIGRTSLQKLDFFDIELCRTQFTEGMLKPTFIFMGVSQSVMPVLPFNNRDIIINNQPSLDTFPRRVGQVVGGMIDLPVLDDLFSIDLTAFPTISHLLLWRAERHPDAIAFKVVDSKGRMAKKVTFKKFSTKVFTLANYLIVHKGLSPRANVIVMFPHGLDYLIAIHACLYAGLIPIPLPPLDTNCLKEEVLALLPLISEWNVQAIICNKAVRGLLKGKQSQSILKELQEKSTTRATMEDGPPVPSPAIVASSASSIASFSTVSSASSSSNRNGFGSGQTSTGLPIIVDTAKALKLHNTMNIDDPLFHFAKAQFGRPPPPPPLIPGAPPIPPPARPMITVPTPVAVRFVTFSPDMERTIVDCGHTHLIEQCRLQAIQNKMLISISNALDPSRRPALRPQSAQSPLITCLKGYTGYSFVYSVLLGIFVGTSTIIISPYDYALKPLIWFDAISKFKVKDGFATYPMLEHAIATFQESQAASMQSLQSLNIHSDGRLNPRSNRSIHKAFLVNGLEPLAMAPVFSTVCNPMVSTRGYMNTECTTLWLDLRALRNGQLSICKESRGQLRDDPDAAGMVISRKKALMIQDSGKANTVFIDGGIPAISTRGWEKFVFGGLPYEMVVFVIGPLEDVIALRGLKHFPQDLESSVEWCLTASDSAGELVCVLEIPKDTEPKHLVCRIVCVLLEDHQVAVDIICFLKKGGLSRSKLREKQRKIIATQYELGKLPSIEVFKVTND
ncbi:hypothetical protein HDV05_001319 [Chytridiales sp. JEL 0842]|nr:hypothetical protein HDV05_001319 [Chytridiales sp. JEL 0842]